MHPNVLIISLMKAHHHLVFDTNWVMDFLYFKGSKTM